MSNVITHKHQEIANHSPGQQGMFFGLGQKLGHSPEDLKEHAKKKFNKDCFQKITKSEMMVMIDLLVKQEEVRERQKQIAAAKKDQEKRVEKTPEERRKEAEEANKKMLEEV